MPQPPIPLRLMNSRRHFLTHMLFTLVLLLPGVTLADALKTRMAERLPAVDALRSTGKVGENYLGFLAPRTKLSQEETTLMNAENADRKEVYTRIARSTKESMRTVGQKRAATIRKLSKKGLWLQDAKGNWYRKR